MQTVSGLAGTFAYDVNGDLTWGQANTITWTSFDMPLLIVKGAASAPEHPRTRQTRGDGKAMVYAGAQEVESNSTGTTVKTCWPYGIGVEIDWPGATATELDW